ncbi:fungistatic metabolite [Colletotrichum sojae]|uniref:Fungistatic metabolite n=1 Tax=Colletotrichum sojae TaxID=2175907 RepID=A0A8H6ING2_9PEZI|nr:fungistatic metabolite [Colletotrichum sojae]
MIINDDGSTTVADFFMPWEKQALDGADKDLGTSPLQILPSSTFSCGDVRRIGVVTGKNGKTYWINLDNMGGYRNGPNNYDAVIQTYQNDNSVYAGAGVYPLEGGYIYINVIQYPTNVFKFSCEGGVPSFTKVAESPMDNAYILGVSHGTVTSLNGQPGTGLLWTLDVQGSQLKIFEAVPKDGALNLVKSFSVPGSTKFGRAVFGDGIMYQGTTQGYLYAFGSPVTTPINCTSPNEFGTADVGSEGEPRTITCTAIIGVTVSDVGLDDTDDFALSGVATLPLALAAGETFSVDVAFKPTTVGLISADVVVNTTNSAEGYSQGTHVRLTGTGESAGPLLAITPPTITFQGVIAGSEGNLEEQIIFSNQGNSELAVAEVQYSTTSAQGPFETWDGSTATLTVGKFTLSNIPATIASNSGTTVRIAFDSAEAGSYGAYLRVVSNGGTKSFTIAGSAGPAPVALVEFQTPDGTGWIEYSADKNFTFGNVTENTSLSLKFRVTNAAPEGGVKLTLTVSKPPFGIPGIISAANQVDLAEGISLAPGESADATMVCSVPKSQWNVDPYTNTAPWTMNTNDPNFEKHFFTFECTAVSEQAPPLLPDGQGRYRYIGCYKENNPGRQLSNQLYGNADNTNAMCIEACAERGFVFCGTQYHTECWGGPNIPVEKVDPRNCNFECGGDLNQVCGGNGFGELEGGAFFSLFADSVQWDGNTTTPTPDPGTGPDPTAPEVNPGVGGYVSEGCYTEATDTRALPNLVDLEEKTVANCVAACSGRRNTYAGLEYGGECWCGNALAEGAVPADNAAECSMPCADNSTEYCGGPSRLNLYRLEGDFPEPTTTSAAVTGTETTSAVPTATAPSNERVGDWLFQGCFTEGDGVRALPARTYANDSMTLESCGAFCEGLQYFGTEYGRECWCGAELDASSTEAPLSDCSFPCAGDDTQRCGAGNRLQVYLYSPEGAATSAAPTTEASATETATATPEFPTASVPANGTSGSQTAVTVTPTEEPATTTLAPTTLEVSTTAEASSTSATAPVLEGDSTTSASPSTTTTSTTTSAAPTPTGPVIVAGNENFTYYGCFSEPEIGRLLPAQVLNDGDEMTIDKCLGVCYDKRYAGVEYGRECWCGDSLSLGGADGTRPAANETGTDCSFTCPGNSTQFCGAGSRISLYILTEVLEELERQNRTVARRF